MEFDFVYVTAGSIDEARRIGEKLVEERLAACVNLFDGMTSIYRWEGAIQRASEAVLIAKTRAELVPAVTKRVKELHSYTCPCVVSLRLGAGNPDFLDWLARETIAPGTAPRAG